MSWLTGLLAAAMIGATMAGRASDDARAPDAGHAPGLFVYGRLRARSRGSWDMSPLLPELAGALPIGAQLDAASHSTPTAAPTSPASRGFSISAGRLFGTGERETIHL